MSKVGDLSLATSYPGVIVRCIAIPDMKVWLSKTNKSTEGFALPELSKIYTIRANCKINILNSNFPDCGILLSSNPSAQVQPIPLKNERVRILYSHIINRAVLPVSLF